MVEGNVVTRSENSATDGFGWKKIMYRISFRRDCDKSCWTPGIQKKSRILHAGGAQLLQLVAPWWRPDKRWEKKRLTRKLPFSIIYLFSSNFQNVVSLFRFRFFLSSLSVHISVLICCINQRIRQTSWSWFDKIIWLPILKISNPFVWLTQVCWQSQRTVLILETLTRGSYGASKHPRVWRVHKIFENSKTEHWLSSFPKMLTNPCRKESLFGTNWRVLMYSKTSC